MAVVVTKVELKTMHDDVGSSPVEPAGDNWDGRVPIQIKREPPWGVACRAGQSGSLQEVVALLALVRSRDIYLPTLL